VALACRDQYYWWSAVDQTRLLVLVCIVVFGKCVFRPDLLHDGASISV